MNMVDRYRRWFEYEQDAHEKVLASFRSVPETRSVEGAFQKAVDLFAHLLAARRLWLYRFGVVAEPPAELFPQGVELAALSSQASQTHQAWSDYFDRLDEAELSRTFEYRSLDGARFRNVV